MLVTTLFQGALKGDHPDIGRMGWLGPFQPLGTCRTLQKKIAGNVTTGRKPAGNNG